MGTVGCPGPQAESPFHALPVRSEESGALRKSLICIQFSLTAKPNTSKSCLRPGLQGPALLGNAQIVKAVWADAEYDYTLSHT